MEKKEGKKGGEVEVEDKKGMVWEKKEDGKKGMWR